jgi:hypothetical protein
MPPALCATRARWRAPLWLAQWWSRAGGAAALCRASLVCTSLRVDDGRGLAPWQHWTDVLSSQGMARRRSSTGATAAATPPAGLAAHAAQARAQELLKERARLLREVQKKQRQLEQVRLQASREAQEAFSKMAPIVERQRALAAQLEALFAELLAKGRLSARAHNQIARLRRSLELQGLLAESEQEDEESDDDPWSEAEPRGNEQAPPRRSSQAKSHAAASQPEHPGARQVGQERRSLREIFRSLARAIHPDQARQDSERERRTEVMKQVTRAYEEGDLARLVELESAWQSQQSVADGGDPELRCRELERLNRELLDQLREVTRELRDAKRDLRDAALSHPPEELVELASLELDDVEGICELLRRFRDGKITLSDLTHGPLPRPRRRRKRA